MKVEGLPPPSGLEGRLRWLSWLAWALFSVMSLDALLIVGSGLRSHAILNLGLAMILFFLPGLFWLRRTLMLRDLVLHVPPSAPATSLARRLLNHELWILVFGLLVMLVGLSGIASRVFQEGLPVFG